MRRLAKQRKQLVRKQGRHRRSSCIGYAFCARAVVVDNDGGEWLLGADDVIDVRLQDKLSDSSVRLRQHAQQEGSSSKRHALETERQDDEQRSVEQRAVQRQDMMQSTVPPILSSRSTTGFQGVNHDKTRGIES